MPVIEIREDVMRPAWTQRKDYSIGRLDTRSACNTGQGHPMFETHACPCRQRNSNGDFPRGWCHMNDRPCDVFEEVTK